MSGRCTCRPRAGGVAATRWSVALVLALCSAVVRADVERLPAPRDAAYARECGSCHFAFPPRLLAASQWNRILDSLDRHFGTDAQVDDATRAHLRKWLMSEGSRRADGGGKGTDELPRITKQDWFIREHREVPGERGARPQAGGTRGAQITSMADCAGCHAVIGNGASTAPSAGARR